MTSPIIPSDSVGSFEFHGDLVTVITNPHGNWAALGQLSWNLGLDAEAQRKAVLRKSWSKGRTDVMEVQLPGDTQRRPQFLIHERIVPMWLANITSSRIKDVEKREKVETAQVELADALYAYVSGQAIGKPSLEMELAMRVIALQDRVAALTASNTSLADRCEEMSVKAEGYDDLIACEGLFDLDAAAKILGPVTGHAGPERFVNMLRGMEIVYQRSKLPRQELIKRGYFAVRTEADDGKAQAITVVTMKGLSWLQAEFREEHPTLTRVVDRNVVQLPQQRPAGEIA